MYLKGSKWSMQRKRKPANFFRIFALAGLVAAALYINQVIVPATPPLFIATATPTRAPETYLNEAVSLIQSGKINQAITTYEDAIKADPTNPGIYVTLARWQVLYGFYDKAMENIDNALLLSPTHALAKAVKGWILAKQGEYELAQVQLDEALQLDPNSALAYAYRAEMYIERIKNDRADPTTQQKAIDDVTAARNLDPNLLEVHRVRGLILEFTNQSEEAIQEYEAAVQLNNKLADLHIALGRNYRYVGDTNKSVDSLMTAIALRPEDPEPYYELAATYLNIGQFSKGLQIAEQAVQLKPSDPILQAMLGSMYFKNLQYGDAIPPLRLALRGGTTPTGEQVEPIPLDPTNDPASAVYYARFGISLANVGECGEALQVAQELRNAAPGDENAAFNAQAMIDACQQQVDNPVVQPTSTP
jgi:tetratricopeptide (TPR) repeat protein